MQIPESVNVAVGERASFQCNHSSSDYTIAWRVNETSLSVLNLKTITSRGIPLSGSGYVYELTIQALAVYNQTSIECVVYFSSSGSSPVSVSPKAWMRVQGVYSI